MRSEGSGCSRVRVCSLTLERRGDVSPECSFGSFDGRHNARVDLACSGEHVITLCRKTRSAVLGLEEGRAARCRGSGALPRASGCSRRGSSGFGALGLAWSHGRELDDTQSVVAEYKRKAGQATDRSRLTRTRAAKLLLFVVDAPVADSSQVHSSPLDLLLGPPCCF